MFLLLFFFFSPSTKLFTTIREAGGDCWAKSARRAAAICQHMLSFLSQSDHYGPIGNKQMSSSAWQSTMMNNHGCDWSYESQRRSGVTAAKSPKETEVPLTKHCVGQEAVFSAKRAAE